jgi:hypothetical protein
LWGGSEEENEATKEGSKEVRKKRGEWRGPGIPGFEGLRVKELKSSRGKRLNTESGDEARRVCRKKTQDPPLKTKGGAPAPRGARNLLYLARRQKQIPQA